MYEMRVARLPPKPLQAWESGNAVMPVMRERRFQCPSIKVLPGEYCVTNRDLLLITTLGSCIAACIRDPVAGVGGMNHFLLPEGGSDPNSDSARYGGYAMEKLINDLLQRGGSRTRLQAKLFGGANVNPAFSGRTVGMRNADFVNDYLACEGIPVLARDLGGTAPRKVYFWPMSGRVLVQSLPLEEAGAIRSEEGRYIKKLEVGPVSGELELFD